MTNEDAARRIAEQIILDAENMPAIWRGPALRIAALLQMIVDDLYTEDVPHG
jgi:hypothetical protein